MTAWSTEIEGASPNDGIKPDEIEIALARRRSDRSHRRQHAGLQPLQFLDETCGAEQEVAAVPQIALRQVVLAAFSAARLLDESSPP